MGIGSRRVRRFITQELVTRQPCSLGQPLQKRRASRVDTVHEIGNRRLAYPYITRKGRLSGLGSFEPSTESFHFDPGDDVVMWAESIGFAYKLAIGQTYPSPMDNSGMAKQLERTFLERAMEALAERYPRERPTQKKLAQLAGLSQPSVNEWREPGRGPNIPNGLRLAKALGVCMEWLYTERGPKRPGAASAPDEHLSPILEAWPDLPLDLRREVKRYTDFVKADAKKP